MKMSALIEETKCLLPRIALIACGCFSPPTPMHLRMFEIARDHFEMQGTHNVVGGIISPTHDSYGKKGLVLGTHRCAMVKLALQSSNWIRVSDWEIQQPQWSRTQCVLQYHQNFMNNYINSPENEVFGKTVLPAWLPSRLREECTPVQLRLLCGADLLESFAVPGLWADEDIEEIVSNHGLVVITRFGSNPEKFIFESDVLTKYQRNITLITNWVPNEVSSSMVRRLLNRGQSVKYLLDDLVLDYIKSKVLYNYKTKYITDAVRANENIIFNRAYIEELRRKNRSGIQRTPTSDTDEDVGETFDEEKMDESDNSVKNLLNSLIVDNNGTAPTRVFCCGENGMEKLPKVMKLHVTRQSPGQAVQVITAERGVIQNSDENQRKKLKITNIADV